MRQWLPHAKNLFRWGRIVRSRAYKGAFLVGGRPGRDAERVLADLRGFCCADRATIFDSDHAVMARREGRREVFVRICNMLNLDEDAVQQLMEVDDGIE